MIARVNIKSMAITKASLAGSNQNAALLYASIQIALCCKTVYNKKGEPEKIRLF